MEERKPLRKGDKARCGSFLDLSSSENKFFTNNLKEYEDFEIGDYTYGNPKVIRVPKNTSLKIGSFCSIAEGVKIILGSEHRVDWVTTFPFNVLFDDFKNFSGHPKSKGNIIIGNDVWIGRDVTILSGVNIGDGAVIGANSLVTKDVEAYTIVGGNPAKVIRKRFSDEIIAKLLKIRWWDWDIKRIKENMPYLLDTNIQKFIDDNYNK